MKKTLLAAPLAGLLISLAMPHLALAKTSTAKITITGGGLTSPVEITDPRILESSNVWHGGFLDGSRGPVQEPPRGVQPYEVSFYVKLRNNNLRKIYVMYYYPNPLAQPGYIYLPGRGETWYDLNVSTIWRGGEGKWNYASAKWEDLIKPLIARSVSRRGR